MSKKLYVVIDKYGDIYIATFKLKEAKERITELKDYYRNKPSMLEQRGVEIIIYERIEKE